jgi:hypothetical protein
LSVVIDRSIQAIEIHDITKCITALEEARAKQDEKRTVNAGVKLQQLAGVKMHQWEAFAHRGGSLAVRMADLLGRAERSSPIAA